MGRPSRLGRRSKQVDAGVIRRCASIHCKLPTHVGVKLHRVSKVASNKEFKERLLLITGLVESDLLRENLRICDTCFTENSFKKYGNDHKALNFNPIFAEEAFCHYNDNIGDFATLLAQFPATFPSSTRPSFEIFCSKEFVSLYKVSYSSNFFLIFAIIISVLGFIN